MLGIPDIGVALAYVLSVLSMLLCVIYAWRNWNKGDESIEADDVKWVAEEKKAEEEL